MSGARLTSKGQLTLPKDIRDDLQLEPGDRIEFVKEDGRYVLRARSRSAMELAGILHKPGMEPLTIEEMDAAIVKAVSEADRKSRAGN